MSILAIETSCDDTCAAVLRPDGAVAANVISSQHVHDRFGGVVPEIASRHHLELLNLVVSHALAEADVTLEDIELLAATQGPGLVGTLLVGLSAAKAIAGARELPFAPIDHLQGHVAANFLACADSLDATDAPALVTPSATSPSAVSPVASESPRPFEPPFVCLIASGGHTLLAHVISHHGFDVLGTTLDDAAGEAFDKGARMLGLGYPGGPALERLARDGDPTAFSFPGSAAERARGGKGASRQEFERGLHFSFAGLKTSLLYRIRELGPDQARARAADLAASYQAAIVERLLHRCLQALELNALDRLAVGGGVACNGELRRRLAELGVTVHLPARQLCTDNAAMIASAARFAPALSFPDYLSLDAYATGERSFLSASSRPHTSAHAPGAS